MAHWKGILALCSNINDTLMQCPGAALKIVLRQWRHASSIHVWSIIPSQWKATGVQWWHFAFFFFFLGIKHSSVWHPVLQNSHHLHDSILRNIQSYPYHKYWEESPSVLLSFSYLRTKLLKPTNLNSNCCQFSFWTSAFLQNSSTARDGRKLPLMFCWKRNTAMNKG